LKKSITLLGKIRDRDAVVTLEKLAFEETVGNKADLGLEQITDLDSNDVYSWSVATLKGDTSHAKVNIIYPATETHIKKYRKQEKRMVRETPELYAKVVLPYVETMKGSRIQWVDNILYHGVEADRVIFRDEDDSKGFVLLPDMYVRVVPA
jgi:m7GpppX diphosphatase